ncbi:MAG: FecR domain-containing protein [Tannerella sp.]|jgi:ferric-dicitrate binding protein FerR (iron transport regulator)|nr:FecR domain-containing protein [Tannerella sp.]
MNDNKEKTTIQNCSDFLADDRFALWRLTGDRELETFWNDFLKTRPELKGEFEKAAGLFAGLHLDSEPLSDIETEHLRQRIRATVGQGRRHRPARRLVAYAAAACLALAAGLSLHHYYNGTKGARADLPPHTIVGENLEAKDIYLITDDTTAFEKNVFVQVNESGQTIVHEANGGKTTILETGNAKMNKLVVPYGKRSQLTLPDGTEVWLNSGTVLEFPVAFTGETREIHLSGEMYIEVAEARNKPFVVHTDGFRVQVYGTKFNISAYSDDDAQSIVLVEGNVSVKADSDSEMFMTPHDMLTYSHSRWDRKHVDVTAYLSWKDSYIMLDHTPVDEVLRLLKRYYNLSFNVHDDVSFAARTCTGKIYLSDNLDDVMETIALLSSTRYMRNEKTIYLQY